VCGWAGRCGGAGGVQGVDVCEVVQGLVAGAAGALQLSAVDEDAEVAQGDAEEGGGLLGGEAAGAWLVVHGVHGASGVAGLDSLGAW
jgi:hypothetical protein